MCKLYWQLVRQSQNTSEKINNVRADEPLKKGKSSRDKSLVYRGQKVGDRWSPRLAIFALFVLWSANNAIVCLGYHWYPRLCIMKIKRCYDTNVTCDGQTVNRLYGSFNYFASNSFATAINLPWSIPNRCLSFQDFAVSPCSAPCILWPFLCLLFITPTAKVAPCPSPSQFCVLCPTPSAQNGILSRTDRTHVINAFNVDASQ